MSRDWVYGVYDMQHAEQCLLIADRVKPIAEYFGVLESSVRTNISRGQLIHRRYKVVKIKEDENI